MIASCSLELYGGRMPQPMAAPHQRGQFNPGGLGYEKEHLATLKPDSGWYPPSIFFQGMKFMLFGDPSLKVPAN